MQLETTKAIPFYANYGYHLYFKPDLRSVDTGIPKVSEYVSALNTLHMEIWAEITYIQLDYAE
jgi:hypothetical protein